VTVFRQAVGTTEEALIGSAAYGGLRSDVGAEYGDQFKLSGFTTTATGLAPGQQYTIIVKAHAGAAVLLGSSYGGARPDVASGAFTHCGFTLSGVLPHLGGWQIVASARSTVTGAFSITRTATITAQANPQMAITAPAGGAIGGLGLTVSGWALDAAAATGTGVDAVDLYAQPHGGGPPSFLGTSYGLWNAATARYSGFSLSTSLPGIGVWDVQAAAHSTVTGAYQWQTVTVTAQADPRMTLDLPVHNSTTGQPFVIGGWAVDLGAASGTGVNTMHVYAYPATGAAAIFLGAAPYGGGRQDVATAFGEAFRNSGFTMSATGLSPGTYTIVAYAMSTVTGTFSQAQSATITIPTPNVILSIDAPGASATVGQPFGISGWAIDYAHPTSVGVDALHVYAYPATGAPIFLGIATTGGARADIGAAYGARFTHSGWGLTASGLPAGWYTLVVYPHSTVTNDFRFEAAATRAVYVQ
jgi:hypothetical protein